ncbi:MAG: hypothetical protein ABF384_04665 [Verrucomicrobiales bacterium]
MEKVGINIEKMQEMINTPLVPPPDWIRKWQTEAEHLLYLAHTAKEAGDLERLKEVDGEAERIVASRKSKTES